MTRDSRDRQPDMNRIHLKNERGNVMAKWIKTNFPGVRYREHPTRKHGKRRDQYFTIRYKLAGKDREEGLGWASENWTAAKAYDRLKELIQLAIANNPDLRVAALNVEQSRAQYRVTRSASFPTVEGSGSFSRSRAISRMRRVFGETAGIC